jgi:hypothetical protein
MCSGHDALARVVVGLALVLAAARGAEAGGPTEPVQAAIRALANAGAVSFSHRPRYSAAIDDLFLGYDAAGKPVIGAALREFKTYEKVTAMIVVQAAAGAYVVRSAEIPDIGIIKNAEKQEKVTGAIRSITGRTVRDVSGRDIAVDAVSGATRYQKRIYSSFSLMARAVVTEIGRNASEWERKPIPAEPR